MTDRLVTPIRLLDGDGQARPRFNSNMHDEECPCLGAYDTGIPHTGPHYVWMAYLRSDHQDPQYRREQWLRDYYLFSVTYLTCLLSGSNIFHCQMFFWNQLQQKFVSFSVDAYRRRVFPDDRKEFKCSGWTFQRLTVTAAQETAMYEFLAEQVRRGAHFNQVGAYLMCLRPTNTGGRSWFCSQLDVATLQHAGFLRNVSPHSVYPGQLYDLIKNSGQFTILESDDSPVRTRRIYEQVGEVAIDNDEMSLRFD